MAHKHHSKRGSKAYSPRKRASKSTPAINAWPEIEGEVRLQGFAGYKAGMTHAFVVDKNNKSTTSGQEVQVPVTVVEVPPMKVAGVRFYERTHYGMKTVTEIWSKNVDKELALRLPLPKKVNTKKAEKKVEQAEVEDVRVLAYTQPKLITGVPKKRPELMEIRVGGGSIDERIDFGKKLLGKEIKIRDFAIEGKTIDVASITKGKGFQGHVKRWGVKLLTHKNSKHRRMVGNLGPFSPRWVHPNVPQAGQMGYHQRTEYNKQILLIGEDGEEITPNGGFLKYGVLKSNYLVIQGSLPGPSKRLIRFRDPVRSKSAGKEPETPEITYISKESKQGA